MSVIPRYTVATAKAMVSMLDKRHSEVDAEASRLDASRSGVPRQLADSALRERRSNRAAAMRTLLAHAGHHGDQALLRILIAELRVNCKTDIQPTYRVGAPVVCAQTSSVGLFGKVQKPPCRASLA